MATARGEVAPNQRFLVTLYPMSAQPLDVLFLGSGNAFGAQGRAFSSFILNGRYLLDCGPTVVAHLHQSVVKRVRVRAMLDRAGQAVIAALREKEDYDMAEDRQLSELR